MLLIPHRDLPRAATETLALMQSAVDEKPDYVARVAASKQLWESKTSSPSRAAAFRTIRATLSAMCIGPVRCAYCEDSLADEIEHIYPKSLFPDRAFRWLTTHSSVGRAMGPKVIGTVSYRTGMLLNLSAGRAIPLYHRLPATQVCWIPDQKTPLFFWNSTSGGVTPDGLGLDPTYDFLPSDSLTLRELSRAIYTIRVLDLNREVLRVARANAFGGFRARLHEYADKRDEDASVTILEGLKNDLLRTPHLTVFAEMRRQRSSLPEIDALFSRAPESVQWPLVPTVR